MQAPVRKAQNSAILKTNVLCVRLPFKTENAAGHGPQTKAEETRHLHSQSVHREGTVELLFPLHKSSFFPESLCSKAVSPRWASKAALPQAAAEAESKAFAQDLSSCFSSAGKTWEGRVTHENKS